MQTTPDTCASLITLAQKKKTIIRLLHKHNNSSNGMTTIMYYQKRSGKNTPGSHQNISIGQHPRPAATWMSPEVYLKIVSTIILILCHTDYREQIFVSAILNLENNVLFEAFFLSSLDLLDIWLLCYK